MIKINILFILVVVWIFFNSWISSPNQKALNPSQFGKTGKKLKNPIFFLTEDPHFTDGTHKEEKEEEVLSTQTMIKTLPPTKKIQPKPQEIFKKLLIALKQENEPDLRNRAIITAQLIPNKEFQRLFFPQEHEIKLVKETLLTLLDTCEQSNLSELLTTIYILEIKVENHIELLKKFLRAEEPQIRISAAILLSKHVPADEEILNVLATGLANRDLKRKTKIEVIKAIARMREKAKGIVNFLSRIMIEEEGKDEAIAELLSFTIRLIQWE